MKPIGAKWTLEKLIKNFPIGSMVTITFDTRKCIVRVEKYIVEPCDNGDDIHIYGLGINANGEVKYDCFGTNTNGISMTREEDFDYFNIDVEEDFKDIVNGVDNRMSRIIEVVKEDICHFSDADIMKLIAIIGEEVDRRKPLRDFLNK